MSKGDGPAPAAVGVLLAAGAGSRYGMPKVLAEQGNWLANAVRVLAGGGCGEAIVVLGAADVAVPAPARAVIARDWADGLSASVRTGLTAARAGGADYAVLHLVDIPDVGADVVARVLAAAIGTPSGIARASFAGRPGHPVVIARRYWPALTATLRGDRGAGEFLRARDDVTVVECADLASGADVDEPGAT
ncbi:MAG: nucleotidyltransferase family protein [Mycobacterium sp.]|nr:nucleotidyltransferase family protein [Mycobacterium sp.]